MYGNNTIAIYLCRQALPSFHSCNNEKRSRDQRGLAALKLVFYSIRKYPFRRPNVHPPNFFDPRGFDIGPVE
jgi:hypothetical protein